MDLVSRAKNICLSPASEWRVIESEPATTGELLSGYALPLAAIGAIAGFIGSVLLSGMFGALGMYRPSLFYVLTNAILGVGVALVMCVVLGMIIDALAPTFNGQKNSMQALKLAVYSYTPAWLAAILTIIPILGGLAVLVGSLYSLYVLYVGIPIMMKAPQDKAVPYTVVIVLCAIALWLVLFAFLGMFMAASMFARAV